MRFFCFILCLFLISSCDYAIRIQGRIVDEDTNKPISGATVNLLDGRDIQKSNYAGYFEVVDFGGFAGSIPDPIINIKQKGYKPFQLIIKNSDNEIQYIVKSEQIWIKYDKPFYPDSKNRNTSINGTWINKWSQHFLASDTLIFYLTKINNASEIERIKINLKTKN